MQPTSLTWRELAANRLLHSHGAGGGIRTHAVPGWKPGAFPLGDARLKVGPGSGGRTHDLAIIDRALCQLSYPWIKPPELVPGAGVETA